MCAQLLSYAEQLFCDPKDCSPPGSSARGILQARILEWVSIPPPGDLPDPEIGPQSPTLAGGFLITEPPGKPRCVMKIRKSHVPWESGHPGSGRAVSAGAPRSQSLRRE